jgi:tetratricopeptide (TPR) repeat protein
MNVQCAADETVELIRDKFENTSCADRYAGCVDYIEFADEARRALHWDEAITLCQRASPPCGQSDQNAEYCRCIAQTYIGIVYQSQGNLDLAEEQFKQCANDFSRIDHHHASWNEAICHYALGLVRLAQGDLDEAQKAFLPGADPNTTLSAQTK